MTKEAMKEITYLLDDYCHKCQVKKVIKDHHGERNAEYYCLQLCKTGRKLSQLGKKLEPEIRVGKQLDQETYEYLKFIGKTDKEVAKEYKIGVNTLGRRKKLWGIAPTQSNHKFNQYSKLDYLKLKEQGYTDKEVARAWRIGNTTLGRWKHKWNLIQ